MNRREAEKLLNELNEGRLITNDMFQGLDIDSYLDKRDDSVFADEWMSAYQRWVQDADSIAEDELLRASREQAFKQTLHHTGDPELAGYVSDDIGLIGAAMLQGESEHSFVGHLLKSYHNGKLPLL
ncbi:hypothetical protein [Paenibacillus sp. ACRRY]|uniref:hypothetical protein n=1 Tax=Paenibacillus sp. ACRRY TaxID=2918208 RepID=UPI001EF3D663|nr:hypothetical protein [Paenibacillus sp. ACRRY]MCG7382347.1 hypothetical protein [Paenibacillus sp. ACRRY]